MDFFGGSTRGISSEKTCKKSLSREMAIGWVEVGVLNSSRRGENPLFKGIELMERGLKKWFTISKK